MKKQEARLLYREKRMALTEKERMKFDDLILLHFQQLPLPSVQLVHTYLAVAVQHEIDTNKIIRYLAFKNPDLEMVVPCVNGEHLDHYICNEETIYKENEWGIAEPVNGISVDVSSVDLVLVPLLCVDSHGHRVGYGKGFYDRFLAGCRKDTLTIGLSYFDPISRINDVAEFDIPLNYCVTPNHFYEFN
jgi:5-formyltetrahydrofolate cyclo-ligase